MKYGADIELVSPEVEPTLLQILPAEKIIKAEYDSEFCRGKFLVIAATDQPELNLKIGQDAREAGALVNVVDNLQACDFIVPAVTGRGNLQIAISSGGKSPALARRVKEILNSYFKEMSNDSIETGSDYRELLNKKRDGLNYPPGSHNSINIELGSLDILESLRGIIKEEISDREKRERIYEMLAELALKRKD